MTNHEEMKRQLREEFAEYCNTDNFSSPPYETQTIADWWLAKIDLAVEEERRRIVEEVEKITTIGVGAIPETNDFANGWNECRKEYFARKFKPFKDALVSIISKDK